MRSRRCIRETEPVYWAAVGDTAAPAESVNNHALGLSNMCLPRSLHGPQKHWPQEPPLTVPAACFLMQSMGERLEDKETQGLPVGLDGDPLDGFFFCDLCVMPYCEPWWTTGRRSLRGFEA